MRVAYPWVTAYASIGQNEYTGESSACVVRQVAIQIV
jgi:hypothetical protein